MKSRYLFGIVTASLLITGQAAFAASCAGGEPDIQNPVPNCASAAPVLIAPSTAIVDEHLRIGRSAVVRHHHDHDDQSAD